VTSFRHVVTGRVVAPREGSALARLVADGDQWQPEGKPEAVETDEKPKTRTRRQSKS
jgi:hypothetical protein